MRKTKKDYTRPAIKVAAFTVFGLLVVFSSASGMLKVRYAENSGSGAVAFDCTLSDKNGEEKIKLTNADQLKLLNENVLAVFKAYEANPTTKSTSLKEALLERKKALLQGIETDPARLLNNQLPEKERAKIASISSGCVEVNKKIEGTWEVFVQENFDAIEKSRNRYFIKTANNQKNEAYMLRSEGRVPISGSKVSVNGLVIDNMIVFDAFAESGNKKTGDLGGDVIIGGPQVVSPILGAQKVITILVNFQNTPIPNLTSAQVVETINQVDSYYQANSYNLASVQGDVANGPQNGWYSLNLDQTCNFNQVDLAAIDEADLDIDFSNYDYVAVVAPFNSGACGWSGIASVGKVSVTTDEGSKEMGIMNVVSSYASGLPVFGHELGHNFGNHHAAFYYCGSVSIADSGCSIVEYGDHFDIMGDAYQRGYFNGLHKETVGWLGANRMLSVTESGAYDIEAMGSITTGRKVLKIQRKVNDYIYVEYRQPIGSDAGIGTQSNVFDGVIIHTVDTAFNSKSRLIDVTPPGETYMVALTPGNTFVDPASGTSIKLLSANEEFATVEVSLGQTDFVAPTVSITSPNSGETITNGSTLRASASDNVGVDHVEFHRLVSIGENSFLGEDVSAPYEITANFPSAGYYLISARAYDLAGNMTATDLMPVTVIVPQVSECGDVDGSDVVNISDAIYLIDYIFNGGPAPSPVLVGDVDHDTLVTISDAVYLINYIFNGGPAPAC